MTILELLEAHAWDIEFNTQGLGVNTIVCRCGDRYGLTESYRAHLAEVLDKHMQEQCYEAWSAGWHDSHYQHTANNERRGRGHPEVAYSNPYRATQPKEAHDGR